MIDIQAEPQAGDFAVDVRIRLPRDPYKRLRWVAEKKYQSTPAKLAEAIVRAWLGGHFEVEAEEAVKRRKFTDPGVREELQVMLDAGMKPSDIAGNLDIDTRQAKRWIAALTGVEERPVAKRHGKTVKSTSTSTGNRPFANVDNVALFQRMYEEGYPDASIAEAIGCSETAVQKQRKMRGMLPQSGRQYGAAS